MNIKEKMLTREQQKSIFSLIRKAGLESQKANLVFSYTAGRTEHSGEMKMPEAEEMINYLKSYATPDAKAEAANKMRRKIISQAHRMGWQLAPGGRGAKVDMVRLNAWCLERSYLTKELNAYTYEELPKLVSQFNEVYKSFLKKVV